MENKINIAEILKDCPKGTKLYSPICGECEFSKISDRDGNLFIEVKANDECFLLNECGYYWYTTHGECLLFPSKDQRDWTKFQRPIEPKFKVGDKLKKKNCTYNYTIKIIEIQEDGFYVYVNDSGESGCLHIKKQDEWKLVPNKFDITTLKPFDKVLVRDMSDEEWTPNLFGYLINQKGKVYQCVLNYWGQCIPYKCNEHLLGTTDDCDEYYKTWE